MSWLPLYDRAAERKALEASERRRIGSSPIFVVEGETFRIQRDLRIGTVRPGLDTWRLLLGVHSSVCPCTGCRPLSDVVDRACGVRTDDRPYGMPVIGSWRREGYILLRPEKGSIRVAARRFFGEVPDSLKRSLDT